MLRICSALVLIALGGPVLAGFSGTIRVIDGDTLDVGDVRVRLHGIDAPELGQTCANSTGVIRDCGAQASEYLQKHYQGRAAQCKEITIDKYQRKVAVCRVEGRDIGRELVAEGMALAYRKYSMDYVADEALAAQAGRGLHEGYMMRPDLFRLEKIVGRTAENRNCRIKGNISSRGEKIYHLPGQRYYAKTGIRWEKGEYWFCSETEARRAGWRKAKF